MTEAILKHVGVLGMRWGHRKNSTAERNPSADHIRSEIIRKKHLSEMSNDEIKDLASRLDLEKRYLTLTKKETSPGRKAVNDVLTSNGKMAFNGILMLAGGFAAKLLIDYATTKIKNPKIVETLKSVVETATKKGG